VKKKSLQIKDFKFSIKLQKSIEKNDGVRGGTLVPLATVSDSGGKGKRSSRTSKRRN
jgi:BRCA1-associated protein